MKILNPYDGDNSSKIIFITGGTKSGKSEFAEYIAKQCKSITYIALSEKRENDEDWEERIFQHKERRPEDWKLLETSDLIGALNNEIGPILIDSISGFVMESINTNKKEWLKKIGHLSKLLKRRKDITIIVGEQVGWGLVSEYKVGNIFIDRIGELQKKLTQISNENWITLNGRAIKIDEISLEIPN